MRNLIDPVVNLGENDGPEHYTLVPGEVEYLTFCKLAGWQPNAEELKQLTIEGPHWLSHMSHQLFCKLSDWQPHRRDQLILDSIKNISLFRYGELALDFDSVRIFHDPFPLSIDIKYSKNFPNKWGINLHCAQGINTFAKVKIANEVNAVGIALGNFGITKEIRDLQAYHSSFGVTRSLNDVEAVSPRLDRVLQPFQARIESHYEKIKPRISAAIGYGDRHWAAIWSYLPLI
jgi:hypothetical protein